MFRQLFAAAAEVPSSSLKLVLYVSPLLHISRFNNVSVELHLGGLRHDNNIRVQEHISSGCFLHHSFKLCGIKLSCAPFVSL